MYTVGFIQTRNPKILIDPREFSNVSLLYNWLVTFLNESDFKLSDSITLEGLRYDLTIDDGCFQIPFTGHGVALLLGSSESVREATEGYKFTDPATRIMMEKLAKFNG